MALEFRSLDGTGNNLQHAEFNQPVGTPFVRDTAPVLDRLDDGSPNARLISNLVVGQGNPNVDDPKLSEAATLWGQFVDHDLDLNRSDGVNHIDIAIPPGDPAFTNPISVTRGVINPTTGTFVNSITGFLDGSQVYGSTKAAADALKAADGAHLKTSDGDNLPIDATGRFVAGDVRVQENPYLTSWQTLFLREHNFQVDKLEAQHHDWTSEHLYQQARAVVTAEIQDITYNEWLPHILGGNGIGTYHGYNPNVDPRISQEFAVAAFRWGHSGIDETIDHVDAHGGEISQSLTDAFKLPATEFTTLGADGFIRSQIADHMQVVDARIVDSLRDGLFDPNGPADLAAINIQRGRDANIGTLNDVRHDLGLKEYTKFEQISSDKATVAALKEAYHGDVNAIDFWVGGLAEKHVNGGELGQTFNTVVKHQFADLRAGDRLYFENQGFSKAEIRDIKHTSLGDIIERNTDVDLPHGQKDVFVAKAIPTHDIEKAASPAPEKVAGLALDQGAPEKGAGVAPEKLAELPASEPLKGEHAPEPLHVAEPGQAAPAGPPVAQAAPEPLQALQQAVHEGEALKAAALAPKAEALNVPPALSVPAAGLDHHDQAPHVDPAAQHFLAQFMAMDQVDPFQALVHHDHGLLT